MEQEHETTRRDFMIAGTTTLLALPESTRAQAVQANIEREDFQGVADLIGPEAARPEPGSDFFDDKPFFAYRYEANDTGIRSVITEADDAWQSIPATVPAEVFGRVYVDHPEYGGDVDAALADVDLVNLGSGSYGTIDPSNDGKTIRGVGANSDITSITADNRANIVGFFFRRQSDDPINLGQNCRLISPYLIGGSVSLGGGSGLLGASLFGESITLTGGRSSVVGCTDLFNNSTVTFASDNNVASGNSGLSFTDNGTGNEYGSNT